MKVKSQSEVAQSYPTLSDPTDCSLPGSSIHELLQARVLEWMEVLITLLRERKTSAQFSHSIMSDSLWPHGLQQDKHPCTLQIPRVYPNSCPLSQWCHPTISSSVILFSSCPQSFPASGSFPVTQFFISGGQVIGSFSLSISHSNEYSGLISFRMDWFNLLAVQGILKSLLQHHSSKASMLRHSAFFIVQLSHLYMTTRKTIVLTRWTFVDKVVSALFNILSRLVISFLPRKKCLNFMAPVTICSDFGAPKTKVWLFPHLFAKKWCDQKTWS